MKTVSEHMSDALLNEARKTIVDSIPDCPENGEEYEVQPAIDECYGIASVFEDVNKNMTLLKKVRDFKKYDQKKLHDLAICLEQIGAYINGLMALAEDDVAEAYIYVNMVKKLPTNKDSVRQCIENCAQEVDPADFDSITSDEDIYDYFFEIFEHFDEVIKAIFKMPWD